MKVPAKCIGCGAPHQSGSATPGSEALAGQSALYACGATAAFNAPQGSVRLVLRNCPKRSRAPR